MIPWWSPISAITLITFALGVAAEEIRRVLSR